MLIFSLILGGVAFLFDHLQIICDMFLLLEKSMHETYMGENIE